MRAARVVPNQGLVLTDAPEPVLPEDGVLIRVIYGGICGSDLHYAQHGRNGSFIVSEPLTLGHEISGTIHAVGPGVGRALTVGTPVTVHPAVPCAPHGRTIPTRLHTRPGSYLGSASTDPHTQGGFAELVAARADQVRVLPENLSLRRAALAEPMAVALHAVSLAGDLRGRRVLVTGCGPIGLLTILTIAHLEPAELVVSDLTERALETARQFGATHTRLVPLQPPASHALDTVIEASGAPPAIAASFDAVATGGTVIQLGIPALDLVPVPTHDLLARELTVRGAWRFDTELDDAVRFLADHDEVEAVITHEFALDAAPDAFAVAADPELSSKVLLHLA